MRLHILLFILLTFSFISSCELVGLPPEGTIVYDVDFPRADSCAAAASCNDGGGSGSGGGGGGGGGNGTTGSGSGGGGYDPDNSSIGYTITESGGSTDVLEGATDTFDIVLNSAPTDNITITVTTPNTGDILISNAGGNLSADNTTLTLTFTSSNWNTPQSVTVTGVEDATDEGGGTTAVNLTVSLTQSLDTDWVPADIPDSTVTANLTDSQATGPPSSITDLAAVAGNQQNTLSWTASSGVSSYKLYWSTSSPVTTGDNSITIDGTDTSHVHGGLTAGTTYYYAIEPINNLGSAGLSNEVSGTPSSFTGCTTSGTLSDPDADLLVHYDFNGNLNDTKNAYGDGRYNLTNTGGTIKFAQGCGYGNAAYFDSSTGYAFNDNFTDDNETTLTDNFTITMWINGDDDNKAYSAAFSSGAKTNSNHQIDVDNSDRLRMLYFNTGGQNNITDSTPITDGLWYHIAAVHDDQNNWTLYKNGQLVGTQTAYASWDKLKIGINRNTNIRWKGYIDEVKVYGRAFSSDNVTDACLLYEECEKYLVPATPTGLTATNPGSGTSINLTWNTVTGADNYTVYWTDDPSTPIDPSNPATYDNSTTVTGASTSATGLTNGTNYDFTIIATNTAGNSSPATEVNATPTLVLPAALDNVTSYHGFYQDYFYTPNHYMPPAYAVTWNPHPDFASGDYYRVFYSDNLTRPIDPADYNTYIGVTNSTDHYAVIPTRPFYTLNGTTYNDGFLENTPLRIAVALRDQSKGNLHSPVVELTPTMASETYREWGNLRISNGFFKDGDNSTLYSFGVKNTSLPLRIEHKDIVNVGERVIIDGSWLRSDVFPQMGNRIGYDVLRLTFYNPTTLREITANGAHFQRSSGNGWRLESNSVSPNSVCGTEHSEDCDWALEIQAEDTVGLIIQNSSNGTGTLNGATDYAAGSGLYTDEQVSSAAVDNASYVGFRMNSTRSISQINLANADAAMSKVAIPFPSPANLTVTPSGSNINLSWDNSTSFTNTYDIYRSADNVSWTLVTSLSGYGSTTYTDASLADNTYYYKIGANGTYYTPDNSTVAAGVIATASPAFKYSITGNDSDVSEDGSSDTTSLNLYLDAAPDGNVVVDITVSDATELAIGSTQLTFTPANYGVTQNWSVTGVDDALDDGNITSQVTISINGAGTTDTTGYASLSNKNKTITTVDDDSAPVLNSVTAGTQLNSLSWNAYSGATAYRIYWSTSSPVTTSSNVIDNISNSATSYQHSGRTAGTTYYYAFVANTSVGFSSLSNELNATPTTFAGCTSSGAVADNDPDLLVHYAFEGNLEDIEDTNSDNRYDLTNEEGTMQFAQGCAQGQAAYIDTSSGYGVNTQFTSSNVGGNLANDNFSISLWVAKDGDMGGFSSAFNTGFYAQHSPTGSQEKAQIDIDDNGKLRMISNSPSSARKVRSSSAANMNQWYHVVAVHNASSDITLYVDGVAEETNSNMNVGFYALVVGLNRNRQVSEKNWKGYIDEVKVFGRTFSVDDVVTDCMKADNCSWVPPTAPTLAGTGRAQAIMLTWNQPAGTDNATIYWRTSGGASEGSPTAPTASDNVINTSDNQTSYLLTGLTGGHYYHFVIKANNRNGSSPVSSVLGNVQPTSFVANTFDANNGGVCKIQNDKSLHCKGRNHLDQYDNSRTARPSAVDVFGITNAETISHAHNKVSVIKSDGSYQHRGDDDSMSTRTSPVTGVSNPIQVGQGNNFVAYLMSDGTVRTRGANYDGQLGDGTNNNETSGSVQVSGITTATKIAVGQFHACALLTNGQVWCWGNNAQGDLGDGTTTNRNSPVQASLPSNTAVDIFVEGRTSATVLSNGKVYTWGSNLHSKAKCNNDTNKITTPRELTVISNVKQIDFGYGHAVILTNDDNVYTCGTNHLTSNVAGNAAFLTAQGSDSAKRTNGAILMDDYNGRVVEVRADNYNSYMLLDNGSLACIGDNNYGQCNNDGSTMGTDQLTPIVIPDM